MRHRDGILSALVVLISAGRVQAFSPQAPPAGEKSPFPVVIAGGGGSHSTPVVASLSADPNGPKSVIFATVTRQLYVLTPAGSIATGWPKALPGDPTSSPAIGDVDGDGIPDIVIGYGSNLDCTARGFTVGGVRAFKADGTLLWDVQSRDWFVGANCNPGQDGRPDPVESTPAIGDVDGDGVVEVAWGSTDGNVYLVDGRTGAAKPGWPIFVRDTVVSSPALFDLDGDGKKEIIIGVDAHDEGAPFNTVRGGYLHAFRCTGQPVQTSNPYAGVRTLPAPEVQGFPVWVDQVIVSSPAVADIDGDGLPEIVVGTGRYYNDTNVNVPTGPFRGVYAFRCDGTLKWRYATRGQVVMMPALGDLDGQPGLEVLVTDEPLVGWQHTANSGEYWTYAIRSNGTLLWEKKPLSVFSLNQPVASPVIGNIYPGESGPQAIVPINTEVCVFRGWDGTQLTASAKDLAVPPAGYSFYATTSIAGAAVVADGTNIGLVTVSARPFPAATDTEVHFWIPRGASTPDWGVVRQNASRTGVFPSTPSCPYPRVDSVTPNAGGTAGGTAVSLAGANFLAGASVSVGGVPCSSAVVLNATTITCSTGAHAAGTVDVVVTNPDGKAATLTGGFTYVSGPSVSGISPNAGPTTGGTPVTISGSGFLSGATVAIGGAAATSVVVSSTTTITAVTPAHATGIVGVVVTNPGGVSGSLAGSFFYVPPPSAVRFYTLTPCRVADTRYTVPASTIPSGGTLSVQVTGGTCGVPSTAKSVSVNVTVVPGPSPGYLALYPGNGLAPPTSNINFSPAQVRANNASLLLATDGSGTLKVQNGSPGANDVILDVNGYYQ